MIGRRFISERARREHQKRIVARVILWVVLALSIFFLIIELADIKQLRIERVRFEGNHALTDAELWRVTESFVTGSYAGLFPKKNILLVNDAAIEQTLLTEFVRLENVRVEREGFHTLLVTSTERAPRAIWCGDEEAIVRNCYYVDENALAFAIAPKLSGGSFITFTRAFPERVLGKNLAPLEEFRAVRNFIESLVALGFHTERVAWRDDAIELFVRVELEDEQMGALVLKIPLTPPYDIAFSNLVSVTKTKDAESEPLSVSDIDYIDLRFENKVFYKKEGVSTEPPSIGEDGIE